MATVIDATEAPRPNQQESSRIVEAALHLNQCHRERRRFAVLTGGNGDDISEVLSLFTAGLPGAVRLVRTLAPTDSSQGFLESILCQFGIEPFEASADELQRLLLVVLRHSHSQSGADVLVVDDAQSFGPRVLETVRELGLSTEDWPAGPLFILLGRSELNRVLDSPGMASIAHLTASRFDLDDGSSNARDRNRTAARMLAAASASGCFVVSCENRQVGTVTLGRDRILIGRAEHCDIRLTGRYVSRQHALLLRNGTVDMLVDLNSTNGTVVNSRLVERRRLRNGDVVGVGNYRLRYQNRMCPDSWPVLQGLKSTYDGTTAVMSPLGVLSDDVALVRRLVRATDAA